MLIKGVDFMPLSMVTPGCTENIKYINGKDDVKKFLENIGFVMGSGNWQARGTDARRHSQHEHSRSSLTLILQEQLLGDQQSHEGLAVFLVQLGQQLFQLWPSFEPSLEAFFSVLPH